MSERLLEQQVLAVTRFLSCPTPAAWFAAAPDNLDLLLIDHANCETKAALTIGAGSGAVRPIIGNIALHDQLEKLIAEFKHVEDVLVFQSGFTSNAGTIPTIMEAEDAIITDSLNHASIIDGCRLSKAKRSIY